MFQNIMQNVNCSILSPPGPTYWLTHQRHPDILVFFISSFPRNINYTITNLDHSPILMQISSQTTQNPPHPFLAKGPVTGTIFPKI